MSGGEQQMCAIGRGMMSAPLLLMIDEMSLGLAPVLIDQLLGAVVKLRDAGVTLLMVEQDVQTALESGGPRLCARDRAHDNGGSGARPSQRSTGSNGIPRPLNLIQDNQVCAVSLGRRKPCATLSHTISSFVFSRMNLGIRTFRPSA